MATSDEQNSKAIDASVGGLVWVRRQNGCWWPGQIMAHHEVPQKSLASAKSGAPIKLLGHDNASVVWYNLEKSKRVKAFRCGEYDTWIETAKAAASGRSRRKAVKYVRRQDAILLALEIENAHLAKDHPEKNEKDNDVKASKVQQPLSEKRRRTPNDSDDEGNRRMRSLEDIEMDIESKGKVRAGTLLEAKQENGFKCDNNSIPNGTLDNGCSKDCSLSMKRKRSPVLFAKYYVRKNRRLPLTKVVESTAIVPVPLSSVNSDCSPRPGLSKSKVSAEINNKNSDSNGISFEKADASLTTTENGVEAIHNKAKQSEVSNISVSATNDSSNGLFDVALNGSTCTNLAATLINGIEGSILKWVVKGKRKSRKMSRIKQERRNAYAEEANNISLTQKPNVHFSIVSKAMRRKSQLHEVKIEVNGNYKRPSVPLISLSSKVTDEAVVGHPVMVEMVEDGSFGHIMTNHNKVPMVDDVKPKSSFKKGKPPIPPKNSSKSKKSSSVSIKTRCLSALSGKKKLTVSNMNKLKTEKSKEQTPVACIPLKLVFSRINEAMKGPARQVHKALPSAASI